MSAMYFSGGAVWSSPNHPVADALLVVDGRIAAVGSAAARAHTGYGDAQRVDLDGGFLMPAFGDGHAHPIFGGLESEGPAIRQCTSVPEILEEVRHYAHNHPDAKWIVGGSYDCSLADSGLFDAQWLDSVVADRPVVLRASDHHTLWCNSFALEVAGIKRDTPDPPLGEIPRRPDGEPLGTLREWGATDLVMAACPPRDEETRLRALARAVDHYRRLGVTWVQDAWVEPADVETYLEASRRQMLGVRVNLALYADSRRFAEQLPWFVEARQRVEDAGDPRLTARTIKFFVDGVVESQTAALLEPYCSTLHDHGMRTWEGPALANAVCSVDAAGFQVHIHAIGDAAVRQALDAIEAAIDHNGPRDRRPVIAHLQLVDAADLKRFGELGVTACMQPLWAQQDQLMTELTMPRLGVERSERQYPTRTLSASGSIAFGSDWPVSSADPLEGIAIAISRQTVAGVPDEGWVPDETVDIETALGAYSTSVARLAFADTAPATWGRLTPGAEADLVWLDRDPITCAGPERLRALTVRASYLSGEPWPAGRVP